MDRRRRDLDAPGRGRGHSGTLPCLRRGNSSRLDDKMSKLRLITARVSAGEFDVQRLIPVDRLAVAHRLDGRDSLSRRCVWDAGAPHGLEYGSASPWQTSTATVPKA